MIFENIKEIKNRDEEYFKKHVSFSCVFTPPYNLKETILFFYENFPGMSVRFNNIDTDNTSYFKKIYSKKIMNSFFKQLEEIHEHYLELFIHSINYNTYLSLIENIVGSNIIDLHKRDKYVLEDVFLSQGPCFIGKRRLFVTTEGRYLPCEKVHMFPNIGDVDEGLKYINIYKIMSEYNNIYCNICFDCPFIRLCIKCYKNILLNSKMNIKKADNLCKKKKIEINNLIFTYLDLYEKNKDAFYKMKSIKIM